MAERIVFIRGKDSLVLQVHGAVESYRTRQAVKVDLNTLSNGQPTKGSFSVAVTNENTVIDEPGEGTIFNNLLLTSDVKGNVEQPNYYFTNSNRAHEDLDILMLTQGYRRFNWTHILNDKSLPLLYQPQKTSDLIGMVLLRSGKPLVNGKISLIAPEQNIVLDTVSDSSGKFEFTDVDVADTVRFVLRAHNPTQEGNVLLYIKQPAYPVIESNRNHPDNYNAELFAVSPEVKPLLLRKGIQYQQEQRQDSIKNGTVLKQINIKATKIEKPNAYNRYVASFPDFKISGESMGSRKLYHMFQGNLPYTLYQI